MKLKKRILACVLAGVLCAGTCVPASSEEIRIGSVVCEYGAAKSVAKLKFGSIGSKAYTGKAIKPDVTVKDGSKKLKKGKDYTLSYKNNTEIGTATVVVTGKGSYIGSKTLTFKIVLGKPVLTISAKDKTTSISWKKVTGAKGYELYYSESGGSFKKLTSTTKTSYSTTKLSARKSYQFKARAYAKVNGKTVYGSYSDVCTSGSSPVIEAKESYLDNPDLKVKKRIKWLAGWDIEENTAAAELFKEVYGVPKTGDDPEYEGRIFEWIFVSYGDRYDKLSALIAADNSPDLFPFESTDFPYGAVMGRYQPIDTIIDLESDKWDNSREIMDQFMVDGKHYCAIPEISFSSLLYYRKSIIKDAGLEDPRTLFKNDKWTWDAFLDMAREFQKSGDDKYAIDGYNSDSIFVASTGTPIVSGSNGVFTNNMYSANVERAMDLLSTLRKENLRYPMHELNYWLTNPKAWADGDILFYGDGGTWSFEGSGGLNMFAKKYGWSDDEICVVPYPRDPKADKYYHSMMHEALMWCKGSKNSAGAAAWIDCCAAASLDKKVIKENIKSQKDKYGWSDYNLDFIYSQTALDGTGKLTPVFEFKDGLGADISNTGSIDCPIQQLTKGVYLTDDLTYDQLREINFPAIDTRINEINQFKIE